MCTGVLEPAEEVVLQMLGLPEAKADSPSWLGGRMLRVPSSWTHRPARDGLANVEIKGPSAWKAAWRTHRQGSRMSLMKRGESWDLRTSGEVL